MIVNGYLQWLLHNDNDDNDNNAATKVFKFPHFVSKISI